MGFRIKGRALLCSLIPSFFCVPLSSQLLGSSLPLCFVKPTSIMTLSLPVAAGLILQAGYGGLVYEVDPTHVSKLRKSMGMLCWLVITIQCRYWRHMIQYFSVFSLFFRDGCSLFTFLFSFYHLLCCQIWSMEKSVLCCIMQFDQYLFLSILFHSTPVTCFALGEGAFSGVSGLFSLSKRADFLMQGYQLHRA